MTTLRVRCVGTPVATGGREEPTEVDYIQPCGWEGEIHLDTFRDLAALFGCPMCNGQLEEVTEVEPTRGGDDHDHALVRAEFGSSAAGADVTGPATAHPTAVAGPPDDLQQAIQAAAIALGKDDSWFAWDDPTGPRPGMPITAARIAVEAAWPHAEGVIAGARAKVDRQREANAAMQQQTDDARATARGAMRKQLDLEGRLRDAHAQVERLETFRDDIRAALRPGRWRGFDGPDGISKDEVIADVAGALEALDRPVAPAQEDDHA